MSLLCTHVIVVMRDAHAAAVDDHVAGSGLADDARLGLVVRVVGDGQAGQARRSVAVLVCLLVVGQLVLGAVGPVLALVKVAVGVVHPGDVGGLVEAAIYLPVVQSLAPAQGRVVAGRAQVEVVVVDLDAVAAVDGGVIGLADILQGCLVDDLVHVPALVRGDGGVGHRDGVGAGRLNQVPAGLRDLSDGVRSAGGGVKWGGCRGQCICLGSCSYIGFG